MFEGACAVRPDDYQAPLLVTQVYRSLGREAEVRAAFERGARLVKKHVKLNPDDVRAIVLGAHALLEMGETGIAREWAERAFEKGPDDRGVLYNLACFYALAGEKGTAIDFLEKAAAVGRVTREYVEHDSDLDPVREEPRYLALLEKL
jgi:adenylate cyclase